jgi:hypothetical protein
MINYCGQSVKLQNTLRFIQRQCPGLLIKESFPRYELDDVYEYLNGLFWTGLSTRHDIIQQAWDRLCKEQAHAS